MEFVGEYLVFLAKAITLVAAITIIVSVIVTAVQRQRSGGSEQLDVESLNQRFEQIADSLGREILDKSARKALDNDRKRRAKAEAKAAELGDGPRKKRLFVLDFDGDIKATAVEALRDEVSAILQTADTGDAALLRLESSGGMVHSYGLASSQLVRLREKGIHLTVAIDKVAASGGYMMACVADEIIAAPFAIVGSIGVIAQLPNFHRLLEQHNIDFELHTAGDYKRTLTMFGENTEAGRSKFREELEEAHELFKQFITTYRSKLDVEAVATGEHWFGSRALELGLIDSIRTSDDLLLDAAKTQNVYRLEFKPKLSLQDRIASAVDSAISGASRALSRRRLGA